MLTGGKLEQEALGEKEKGLRWWEWCQESLSGSVSALYLVQCLAPSCHQPGVFPLYWVLSYIHYFIYSSSQLYGAFCSPLGPSTIVFALRLPSLDGHLWLPFSSIFLLDKGMCLSGTLPFLDYVPDLWHCGIPCPNGFDLTSQDNAGLIPKDRSQL